MKNTSYVALGMIADYYVQLPPAFRDWFKTRLKMFLKNKPTGTYT